MNYSGIAATDLKHAIPFNEFDYPMLCQVLKNYAHVRMKIQHLVKTAAIIRVKKGLYVLSDKLAHGPVSLEILANLIYGPSYISLEYALSFYHLIPERVYEVTSITPKRNKSFQTPLGLFSYRYLARELYPLGIQSVAIDDRRSVLMATPEKALIDALYFSKIRKFERKIDIENWLFEDKRLDPEGLRRFNRDQLLLFRGQYSHSGVNSLIQFLTEDFL